MFTGESLDKRDELKLGLKPGIAWLVGQFNELYELFIGLLSRNLSARAQLELANDIKLLQFLREISMTLEALLISLSGAADVLRTSNAEALFSSLFEAFWNSSFFSRKELTFLSTSCQKFVDKIRNLQCFILITAGRLDDVCLYGSNGSENDHFLRNDCSRLLTSVSSLSIIRGNAPLLLFAAVCGSVFATSVEETNKANNYAAIAIRELGVFEYLCDVLSELNSAQTASSVVSTWSNSDFLTIPESLSLVCFSSHLAVFDLVTLLARQVALDSLGDYRTVYTRVLAKTLSVVVHCSGVINAKDVQSAGVGRRIASIIEDVAQRFPMDLDLLHLCTSLLNTGVNNAITQDEESVTDLVVQLISSVPYFAERCNLTVLKDLVRFHDPVDECEEVTVSLLRQHWALPPNGTPQMEHFAYSKSSFNPLGIRIPAGTRGVLGQNATIVVWQHEYSLWPVLNAIVVSAEQVLSLNQVHKQNDLLSQPSTLEVSTAISRLVSCLDFVNVCLLARIEPARCLAITESIWTLVTRIFTESLSEERETPLGDLLTTLSADCLLPCLLRLTAHSVTLELSTGTECDLIHGFSNGVFRYLQADRILLPSAVLLSQGSRQQLGGVPVYTLTDSCLLRIISTSSSTSLRTAEISPTTAYRLLSTYLDMSLGLLSAEKAALFAGMESWFTDTLEEEAMVGDNHSPLLACLVFCYDLLVEVGGGDSRRFIIPKLLMGSSDTKSGILQLVNKALLFFVELLTSYSLEGDDGPIEITEESNPPSLNFPLFHFRDLCSYARRLLVNSESLLNCLVSLTKISVYSLRIPCQSIDFDFLRFPTRLEEKQVAGVSALGQYRVQSTWLAITLLHNLFSSHSTTLLKILSVNDATSSAYFLYLLDFLDPTCPVGLTRAAVSLLKKLIRFSERLFTPHLHDMQPRLLGFLIHRLRSTSEDQITRTGLFDWLAEAVMLDVLSGATCAPFNGPGFGFLRIISSNADKGNLDGLQGIVITALQELKADNKERNSVSTNLYWSLLKLISAIWMQPNNPFRIQIHEASNFWQCLSDPFFNYVAMLKESEAEHSIVDLEIAGSYATVVAIELFESLRFTNAPDVTFLAVCKQFVDQFLESWLRAAFRCSDDTLEEFSESPVMTALDWAMVRWKSVFCALLKWNTSVSDDKLRLIFPSQIVGLVVACLDKATTWVGLLHFCTIQTPCELHGPSSQMSALPTYEWIGRAVALLEYKDVSTASKLSTNRTYSHFHADLMAFICLFLPKCRQVPPHLYDRLFSLCIEVFQDVSLLSRVTTVEAQALEQAMNLMQAIWNKFDAINLANCLVDAGIINNLIRILAQHSMTFSGAELGQTIVRLLTCFLLPAGRALYPDLSIVSFESKIASSQGGWSSSQLTQVLASYTVPLVQALRLPPTQQLMQWLVQADKCKSPETSHEDLFPNTAWSEFLLSQLRLIILLVVQGGGASDGTPMAHLLKAFLLNNHEQLCALLTAPPRGLLITSAVLDLYWCAMRSSPGVAKLVSPTCVASAVLFSEGRRDERPLPDGASICLPSDIWTSVYSAAVQLTRHCALFLLRPGSSDSPKAASSSSAPKHSPDNPKSSKLFVSLKFLPILRLLSSCLRLVAVETPRLGDLSLASVSQFHLFDSPLYCSSAYHCLFFSTLTSIPEDGKHAPDVISVRGPFEGSLYLHFKASEIAALTPEATLNFATPSMEPSNVLTFGVLFSVARTSSQLIVDLHNSQFFANQPCDRHAELLSQLIEVNELAFSLIYSQATIWLMNPGIDVTSKHTLSRALAVEFQSYNFLGRSTRRGMKVRGCHTPTKNSAGHLRHSRDSPPVSDSTDLSDQRLSDLLTFLAFAERFSDFVK
ncbi:unnamed protein product [Taenia asiatica]|uniref:Non-specific serine/threonine protein kinase n=1 Tax=Taenia asiatica TaxID=60517 RepID=A0A158R8Y8_TAEAS|nr:unnamed protein product [Taenia asiatica]